MKKILVSILCLFTLFTCVSCGKTDDKINKNSEESSKAVEHSTVEKKAANANADANSNKKQDEPQVKPDELPYKIDVLAPDLIGSVYGNLTFTNNSKYPVTMFELTVQYTNGDGNKDKTYFSSYDTILPGETSPIAESFCSSDWSAFLLEYKVYDKETGKYRRFTYDYKLDQLKASSWSAE